MRKLLFFVSLIVAFAMAQQSSHAANILYVFGNGTAPNAGDQMVINHFTALGHTVTTILDSTVAAGGAAAAAGTNDLVYISGGCASGNIRGKGYETLAKPIISGHQNATLPASNTGAGPLGFGTANNGQSNMSQVFIDTTAATNVLAANLAGTITLFSDATLPVSRVTAGVAPNAPFFALMVPRTTNYNCMIAIDAGGKLADGSTAPAKRVLTHVYTDATRNNAAIMTAQGWRLFDAQLYWCLGLPLPTLPPAISPLSYSIKTFKGQNQYTSITVANPNATPLTLSTAQLTGATGVFSIVKPTALPVTIPGLSSTAIVLKGVSQQNPISTSTASLKIGVSTTNTTVTIPLTLITVNPDPRGWFDQDIGNVGLAGSANYSGTPISITGAGADIWGTADAFHYLYQNTFGDFPISVRTVSFTTPATNVWAKAGVMIRETTAPNSKMVYIIASASDATKVHGVSMGWRNATGGACASAEFSGVGYPIYVRLVRSGDTFTGYYSTDGTTWTMLASTNVQMNYLVTGGLCVTSHDVTKLNTSTFDNLDFNPPAVNPVKNWSIFE